MSVFVLLMLPTVVALGLWQLDRGEQKRTLEMAYLEQMTELPRTAQALLSLGEDNAFTRVRLAGAFTEEVFLVDNQIHDGVVGYWVVHAFAEDSGEKFLLNRGFVPAGTDRGLLPEVALAGDETRVVGMVWPFLGLIPLLDEQPWGDGYPKRVQRLDVARMAALVDAQPWEIRLEPGQPGVVEAAPFAALLSDAKHNGYAATWFGLATALTVGYLIFGVHRARERS